jgi:hypothetical protein
MRKIPFQKFRNDFFCCCEDREEEQSEMEIEFFMLPWQAKNLHTDSQHLKNVQNKKKFTLLEVSSFVLYTTAARKIKKFY